jgi:hypothetical protein
VRGTLLALALVLLAGCDDHPGQTCTRSHKEDQSRWVGKTYLLWTVTVCDAWEREAGSK